MADFAVGLAAGCVAGIIGTLIVVALYAALVVGGRADDMADAMNELATLRTELARVKQAAHDQQVRADYYYDLYCTGAKANAALRNGRAR